MDIPAQIENLKENKLIIEDEAEATLILQRISYYRLIKAYGPYFKGKYSSVFRPGTTFNQIYRVYEFDDHLRHLLMPYLQEIEITLRCQISNYFCVKYGSLGYLDASNFDEDASHSSLKARINTGYELSKESPIIKNFQENYKDSKVPLYAGIEVFTFGTLARFYKAMKKEDRIAIASMYKGVNEKYLSSWLVSIGYVRNLCSHFNRLYKKNLTKKPLLYKKKQDKGVDNSRLYGVLCCMRYLQQSPEKWLTFVNSLRDLLEEYKDCVTPEGIGCNQDDWAERLLDQIPDSHLGKLYLLA